MLLYVMASALVLGIVDGAVFLKWKTSVCLIYYFDYNSDFFFYLFCSYFLVDSFIFLCVIICVLFWFLMWFSTWSTYEAIIFENYFSQIDHVKNDIRYLRRVRKIGVLLMEIFLILKLRRRRTTMLMLLFSLLPNSH